MAQDAFSAFEQIMKTQEQNRSTERTGVTPATGSRRPPEMTRSQHLDPRHRRRRRWYQGRGRGGDKNGRIIAKLKRSTPAASPPLTEQAIADVVTELLADHQVTAIGLGAAGFVDGARATMLFAPNLAWRDEPLKQRVEERLGRPVVVENYVNALPWAQARFGAARGYRDVMLVAVGTGIGAGDHRRAVPRPLGNRLRAGARPGGRRRQAVRLREPGLLGAVRQRQCPGRRGASSPGAPRRAP